MPSTMCLLPVSKRLRFAYDFNSLKHSSTCPSEAIQLRYLGFGKAVTRQVAREPSHALLPVVHDDDAPRDEAPAADVDNVEIERLTRLLREERCESSAVAHRVPLPVLAVEGPNFRVEAA